MEERLQKVLAEAGVGSRRTCEEYILAGRIHVNNEVVTELGTKVDPSRDVIRFDGELIKRERKFYFALNKPKGFICSSDDAFHHKKVIDIFTGIPARLYTVGRLDLNSEGLIFVTNDGDFANAVLHPREKITKTYLLQISSPLESGEIEKLEKGVWFDGAKSLPAKVHLPIQKTGNRFQVKISIFEGRKRQLRRMFEVLGHRVRKLKRTEIGCVSLGKLRPGEYRELKKREIQFFLDPRTRKQENKKC
jgi:23S rRNA pseudouridine2605 synthase